MSSNDYEVDPDYEALKELRAKIDERKAFIEGAKRQKASNEEKFQQAVKLFGQKFFNWKQLQKESGEVLVEIDESRFDAEKLIILTHESHVAELKVDDRQHLIEFKPKSRELKTLKFAFDPTVEQWVRVENGKPVDMAMPTEVFAKYILHGVPGFSICPRDSAPASKKIW